MRSGVVLTYCRGRNNPPEVCYILTNRIDPTVKQVAVWIGGETDG